MNDYYVYMYLRSRRSKSGPVGSPYYVGKGRGKRVLSKKRRCKPPSDLSQVVYFATDLNERDAHQLEMLLIHRFGRIDNHSGCLANLTDGGEGTQGFKWSESNKAKLSDAVKNIWKTEGHVYSRIGSKHTEESKALMRAGTKRRLSLMNREQLAIKADKCRAAALSNTKQVERLRIMFTGKQHSEETKQKISLAAKKLWADRRLLRSE